MNNHQLIDALHARKAAIEALMLNARAGDPAYPALWAAFQTTATRYWRAVVWLNTKV